MKITTIIPVYNAQKYLIKAVESVLQCKEVIEIILIEDGSMDDSLEVCTQLQKAEKKIKLFRHPGGVNKGAGASRNLGISKASGDYISFLDADDFYLPNRFEAEKKIFNENPNADAIYGALGVFFYSDDSKKIFNKIFFENQYPEKYLTTMTSVVDSDQLFENLLGIQKNSGYFHLDCLTIRYNKLKELTYWFNEKLKLHQDTEFIIRLSYHLKVFPGSIHAEIAKRGVHQTNRITSVQTNSRAYYMNKYKLFRSLYIWSKNEGLHNEYVSFFNNKKIKHQIGIILPFWQKTRNDLKKYSRKTKLRLKRFSF